MKIRTITELDEILSEQSARRKHEMVNIRAELQEQLSKQRNSVPRKYSLEMNYLARLSPVVAYAHWEGFIKHASLAYVTLAGCKSRPLSNYTTAFQAMACRNTLLNASAATRRVSAHIELIDLLTEKIGEGCSVTAHIDTESNLTWSVFGNICKSVGFEDILSDDWWRANELLVGDMVSVRCSVAHGEAIVVKVSDGINYLNFSIAAVDRYSEIVMNAARGQLYLRETCRANVW